jgi:hypothetical protein
MAISKLLYGVTQRLMTEYADGYEQYLMDCESWSEQGYRPHYCEHGTNQWTDYDNICGGCEDGITMSDPGTRRLYALIEAKQRMAEYEKMTRAIRHLRELHIVVPSELYMKRLMFLSAFPFADDE